MRVILDVVQGPRKGQSFSFDGHDTFIVGRSRLVHCAMPEDTALSRDHFLIEIQPPRCELRDLGSTNGTLVNDLPVTQAKLDSGDRISAGQSVFVVRIEGAPGSSHGVGSGAIETVEVAIPVGPILCMSCGTPAPSGVDITSGSHPDWRDSISWLCEACRLDVATTFQPIPHYTTLRELGRGAMGIVYLAQHNATGRKVALKLIAPETAAARSAIDRFLREMNVISRMKHPNIVEYFEQGTNKGQFWFAMEHVAGPNLEELAQTQPGRYPIAQSCRMAYQVLKGLEHAHGHGFVHRDIKPENILIGKADGGLIAKISDFGLAKSFRGIGLSGLTFSGEMRGTIPFMPPEQVLDFKKVLPSGDLYATAATLYYLISGQFIYDQNTEGDVIRMLLEDPPVPISQRRPDVPTALADLLQKCLARDPADRYPTAGEMRKALRPFC